MYAAAAGISRPVLASIGRHHYWICAGTRGRRFFWSRDEDEDGRDIFGLPLAHRPGITRSKFGSSLYDPEGFPQIPRIEHPRSVPFSKIKIGCWYECIAVDHEVDKLAAIRLNRRLKEVPGYLRSLKPHRVLVLGLIPEFQIVRFAHATRFGSNATPINFVEGRGWNPVEGRRFIPVGNVPHYCDDMIRFPTSHFVVHGYIKIDCVLTTQYQTEHEDLELKYLPDAYPLNNVTGNPYFPGHDGMRDITSPLWSLSYLKDLSRTWSEAMYTGKGYDEGLKDWKRALHMLTRYYRRYGSGAVPLRRLDDLQESERVTLSLAGETIPADRRQKVGARKKVQGLTQEKRRIEVVEKKEAVKRSIIAASKAPVEVKPATSMVPGKQKQKQKPAVSASAPSRPNTLPTWGVATTVKWQLPAKLAKLIRKPETKRTATPPKKPPVVKKKLEVKTTKVIKPTVVAPVVAVAAIVPPPPLHLDEPVHAIEQELEEDITFGYVSPTSYDSDDGW
ncbi:hypothetical protein BZA05DRAFT_223174 [Tricharina praecox]|uniref:uncharacterized protein n=1 Tax=Tricharina praecox TaxID=43433 RepID=UPI00221E58FF|nr:uncharacterized protein BZA05DRAFT_223174 [Tricharina praecox]KAI5855990.1 hypothetical protein BZA05DRAFT_223174 [Tricharina praecox]